MTNYPKYCSYHRMISHPIKDCYVFKDIIKDMIRKGEIEIERALAKGPTASSNATLAVEQRDESCPSSFKTNEGIPTVSLPPYAVSIKFITDDGAIVWPYLDTPPPSPGAPTLYDFYLDPSLEAWATSKDDDDDGFGWQTYFSRRSFWQVRASQSPGVKIRGQKPPQKKNKRKKSKVQKETRHNFRRGVRATG